MYLLYGVPIQKVPKNFSANTVGSENTGGLTHDGRSGRPTIRRIVTNVSISIYGQKCAHVLLLSPATITQSSGQ
ncbi:hypothetical protein DTO280E4_749 [Paecilomyces variotii]|nr:hypothetical protein DTO280E4_749 [Paecilomyces variotii]KAJ9368764.1 hypothetical protein DTO282E5_6499 [Paecilomyces variotii]KAJ9411484.1 hypothetical protein DTO045G8_1116 [Paecilomyces variotii]